MAEFLGGRRALEVASYRGVTSTKFLVRVTSAVVVAVVMAALTICGLVATPAMAETAPSSDATVSAATPVAAEGRLERPVVYFTFDDGPDAAVTGRILDILDRYNARATFFVVGSRVGGHPGVARRIVDEGHAIANHSYGHPQLTTLSDASVRFQLQATNDAIAAVTGVTPTCYRPPYGSVNDRVHQIAVETGLPNAQWTAGSGVGVSAHFGLWDIDTLDWKLNYSTTRHQLSKVSGGDVVLMHSLKSFSADMLAQWMGANADRFRFEPLPGCGGRSEPPLPSDPALWYRYQVARLYLAYFNRAPDYAGVKYWNTLYGGGRLTLPEISDQFALSAEFANRHQATSNRDFVAVVYRNVLGRAPDQKGWDYWTAQLDQATLSRGALMVQFSESPEFVVKAASRITGSAWNGDPAASYARGIELNVLPGPED